MKSVLFLTDSYFPKKNPQAILLRNVLFHLSKDKRFNVHLATSTNLEKKKLNFKYKLINFRLNKFWQFVNYLPFFSRFNFISYKYKKQLFELKNYIKKHKINLIVSYSNPYLLNIFSHILSNKLKIKNIIHYSDPIINTIYKRFIFKNKELINKNLEKKILTDADHIVINNKVMANFIYKNQNKTFLNKTSIIPHSFFENDYKKKQNKPDNKKIQYFGALNKIRNPIEFIKIFIKLKKNNKISKYMELHFFSNLDQYMKKIAINYKNLHIKNKIFFHKSISYKDSIKEMFKSFMLLAIDAKGYENIYLTTKIIQYLRIKKPVLNVTQINSPNFKLGVIANFFFLNVNDKKLLEANLTHYLNKYSKFKPNKKIIKKYESKNISKMWKKLILDQFR